jgi:hypothetical protein
MSAIVHKWDPGLVILPKQLEALSEKGGNLTANE